MRRVFSRAGFAPVADVDRVTVRYDHVLALFADLRAMGETNVLVEGDERPLSQAIVACSRKSIFERFSEGGHVVATFEILTLTG